MARSLRTTFRLSVILLSLAVLAGCASKPSISFDYDRGADFGAYQTWNFIENVGPDYDGYESLFTRYMLDAVEIEMNKRGYTKSNNPDLFVNFNAVIQDKTKVTQTPSSASMGGYYGYRGASYGAWGGYGGGYGGYGYGTETRVSQFTEGTVNIDVIDAKKKQLVWEAVGVGKITDDTRENLHMKVMEGVPQYFALYPFVAGNPTPVTAEK